MTWKEYGERNGGPKGSRESAVEWLDYQGKLSAQSSRHRHLVFYNHSGMNVAAAYFDTESCPLPFIVDAKTYWAAFSSPVEANLVAILNFLFVTQSIKRELFG